MGAYVCQGQPKKVPKEAEWKWCILFRWANKTENQDYFSGPDNVERMQL